MLGLSGRRIWCSSREALTRGAHRAQILPSAAAIPYPPYEERERYFRRNILYATEIETKVCSAAPGFVEAIADTKSCSGLIGVLGVMEFRRKYRSLLAVKAYRLAASLSYLVVYTIVDRKTIPQRDFRYTADNIFHVLPSAGHGCRAQ